MRPIDLSLVFRNWVSSASAWQQDGNICKACNWCLFVCNLAHLVTFISLSDIKQGKMKLALDFTLDLKFLPWRKIKTMEDPSLGGNNFTANPAVCSQPLHNQAQLWSPGPFRQLQKQGWKQGGWQCLDTVWVLRLIGNKGHVKSFSPSVSWSAEIATSLQEKRITACLARQRGIYCKLRHPPNTLSAGTGP